MTAFAQSLWADTVIATLADAGVRELVVSPGSRSTPLVAAIAKLGLAATVIVDERAAAFYALGAARATGLPAALICTSGTAAAHYLPAIVEASVAHVPLIVVTANRPAELQQCGASQTIDQVKLYGDFVRGAFDLGAPAEGELAVRAVRRKLVQAVTLARGPLPGPVHVDAPFRKPLEPVAYDAALLARGAIAIAPPRLAPDRAAVMAIARAIADEPEGIIVAGVLEPSARAAVAALAARTGYPLIAESGSGLRFGALPEVTAIDHAELIPTARRPVPKLVLHVGGEPVGTPLASERKYVLAAHAWQDADSSASAVIVGDIAESAAAIAGAPRDGAWRARWSELEQRAASAIDRALAAHPTSEGAVIRAALGGLPDGAQLQVGNSLPIRVIDQVAPRGERAVHVITQRGAAGIDGLIASALGAAEASERPTLLVLGDVSFAHDLGALVAARTARAPLAILVIDNAGGQIFSGLPIARTAAHDTLARFFTTAPGLDPVAIAQALGLRAARVTDAGAQVAQALASPGATVLHAVCSSSGAHDVRRAALEDMT